MLVSVTYHKLQPYDHQLPVLQYSAGCQVFNSPIEFNSFMRLCEEQRKLYGNSFTYTLINEEDM